MLNYLPHLGWSSAVTSEKREAIAKNVTEHPTTSGVDSLQLGWVFWTKRCLDCSWKKKRTSMVIAGNCRLCGPLIIAHNISEWNIMSNEKKLFKLTLKLALAFILSYGHTHTHNCIFTCIQHSKLIIILTSIPSIGYTIKLILTSMIILTHFNTCTVSQAYSQAHTHIHTHWQPYSYSQSYMYLQFALKIHNHPHIQIVTRMHNQTHIHIHAHTHLF